MLRSDYRKVSLQSLCFGKTDAEAVAYLAKARWGNLGQDVQVYPSCGEVAKHYAVAQTGGWKCRSKVCGKQFTIFSGTKLHPTQHAPLELLSQALHFMEAKDSRQRRSDVRGFRSTSWTAPRCWCRLMARATADAKSSSARLDSRTT